MEPKVIRELSAFEEEWAMNVRIARKSTRETYSKNDRKLDILRLILIDQEGNKILATLFNEIIDKFDDTLENGKSYIIRNANVRHVKERYLNVNDRIELSFKATTEVEEISDPVTGPIMSAYVKFNNISKFTDGGSLLDVVGMVVKVRPAFIVNVKTPTERTTKKREVTLLDSMSASIKLYLWGDLADNEGKILEDIAMTRPIIAALNVKAGYYEDQLQLSTLNVSIVEINPELLEKDAIKDSFSTLLGEVGLDNVIGPTKRMMDAIVVKLDDIIESNVEKLYCVFIGKIVKVQNKNNPWYETCSMCNARVYPEADKQTVTCTRCRAENLPFTRKYLLKLIISDGTNEVYATLFDAAEYLVGCPVSEYAASLLMESKKEACYHYKNLILCESKEYKFLLKMDFKRRDDRARKRLVIEEVYKIDGVSMDDGKQSSKKLKVEN